MLRASGGFVFLIILDDVLPSLRKRKAVKLRSVRTREGETRQFGYLWHYGHFFHDMLLPLNDWLIETQSDPKRLHLYFEDTPDQSTGPFADILRSFFGIAVTNVPSETFNNLPYETLELRAYLSGPYQHVTFDNVLARAEERYGLDRANKKSPKVILIERGWSPHGFEDKHELRSWPRKTGKQRRRIANHSEVASILSNRYGDEFCNVVLETMYFREQLRHFYHARLVIGQHGAGLNNIAWMKNTDSAIIEISPVRNQTFIHMSDAKKLQYRLLGDSEENKTEVNIEELSTLLSEIEAGNSVLDQARSK